MPADLPDPLPDARAAAALLRRAAGAAARDAAAPAALDLLWREDWPDERLRAAVRGLLGAVVQPIERELRLGAARRLAEMQASGAAERLLDDAAPVADRLDAMAPDARAALLRHLHDRARLDLLAAALPPGAPAGERPSLLVRLADCPEPEVAARARELLALAGIAGVPALPPPVRAALAWWCAAVLRGRLDAEHRADHALAEAARELLAHDEPADSAEDAAARLAAAIAARPDELPGLLVEALGDRRPELFAAVLAHSSGLDGAAVRAMLLDPAPDRLLLLLRAQDVDRTTVARIGVSLAEADPRRDLDRFADALDALDAVDPEEAAAFFAPLALPPEYRAAREAVERAR